MIPDPPVRRDGLCACGCGRLPVSPKSRFVVGHYARTLANAEHLRRVSALKRGIPRTAEAKAKQSRSVRGERNPNWNPESKNPHTWIWRNWTRLGVCEECRRVGKTDFSFQKHPQKHTRERSDYRELCRSCHMRFDAELGVRSRSKSGRWA